MELLRYIGYAMFGAAALLAIAAWCAAIAGRIAGGDPFAFGPQLTPQRRAGQRMFWKSAGVFVAALLLGFVALLMIHPDVIQDFFRPPASDRLP